jgi:methanogenic corrinoid protein MtbC1
MDLGVNVPPMRFVEEAVKNRPDIIVLSGLLTVVFESMKTTVDKIREHEDPRVARTPVIIGGGIMNALVCADIGADYWAIDAMTGVQLCGQIMEDHVRNNA